VISWIAFSGCAEKLMREITGNITNETRKESQFLTQSL